MNVEMWAADPNKVKQYFGELVTIDFADNNQPLYTLPFSDLWDEYIPFRRHSRLWDRSSYKGHFDLKSSVAFEFRLIANLGI